jgi:hypothetical protein
MFVALAFMYGTVMPAFYILAFIAAFFKAFTDRIMLCYYFQKPPTFNAKMIYTFLKILRYIPFVSLPFAFWQLGNRQILDNVVVDKKN